MTRVKCHPHASPNFGPRKNGAVVDTVVLHYTAMDTADGAIARLCDPEFEVSAHYVIAPCGRIVQMVDEGQRAWHAGAGQWGDVVDINSCSIGIELANTGRTPFAAAQMDALGVLLADIAARHAIAPERIIGHSDMAPSRKIDPGPRFDWRRLAQQGLSVWPRKQPPLAINEQMFFADLTTFGYSTDVQASARLSAFRDRFRPRHVGPLDEVDMAMARDLAMRFPVDRTSLTD